ncbi:MAG: hypothetical protein H7A51_09505 [Akkermansiaceae bacterium]|nr:hypothetical protein [Akkermansiaceae bacterium]
MNVTGIAESAAGRADGISGADSMIPGERHLKTGPKFDALRRYNLIRHVVKNDSASGAQATINPMDRLPGDIGYSMSVSQRDLGQYQRVELGGTAADLTAVDRPNIHPIMAEASCAFDFSCFDIPGATDPARKYGVRAHLYPTVKLWNPYNVSLKIPDYVYLIRCIGDSRLPSGNNLAQTMDFKAGVPAAYQRSEHLQAFRNHMGSHDAGAKGNPLDAGEIRRYFGFLVKSVTIEPGETVVFSPDWKSGKATLSSPGARGTAKYGFDFSDNPMTASAYPGEGSFYLDFPNIFGTRHSTYGFEGSHMWTPETGAGEQAMLKAVPSGTTGGLDYKTVAVSPGSAKNFPTVAYLNTSPAGLFYDMNGVQHASYLGLKTMEGQTGGTALAHYPANGVGNKRLSVFTEEDIGPPPRFWRYGMRLHYYDELGGIMDGFYPDFYGNNSGSNTAGEVINGMSLFDSWNPRAAFSHTSWISQNAVWSLWSTGTHYKPAMFPLITGGDAADAPFGPVNGKYLANPLSAGEGRGSEPVQDQRIVIYHLPRPEIPLMSLADLRHAELSYSPWHPAYIVGRGKADGRSDPDATIIRASNAYSALGFSTLTPESSQRWTKNVVSSEQHNRKNPTASWGWLNQDRSVIGKVKASLDDPGSFSSTASTHDDEILVYDIAYEVNHALWDRFFLSSIPYDASGNPVWYKDDPLANNRLHLGLTAEDASRQFEDGLSGSRPGFFAYHQSGRYLMNRGAFNVNSTSVDAWKVMLNSLRGLHRQAAVDGKSSAGYGGTAFSGLLFPGISEGQKAASNTDSQVFAGYRELDDSEIEDLAEAIVEQVKLRGPFLTLGDFVNRRLVTIDSGTSPQLTATEGTALMSPLEAAIELSGINSSLQTGADNAPLGNTADDRLGDPFSHWMDKRLMNRWKTAGLPGYLDQGALLSSLGSAMTTRGDTFVIRAYGEARSAANSGTVLARAWCEAVVQRSTDYVNPEDDAMEPLTVATSSNPANTDRAFNTQLSEESRRYGRRYIITQFRWLHHDEV